MDIFTSKKKLGFGLMRLPLLDANDAASIDIEQTKQMVDAFLENGFTYFDTAWMYCGFKSENATKEALVDRHPRNSYTLATKLHAGFIKTKEDRDKIFEEQRKKTGVTYFDYYLLHDMGVDHYEIYEKLDCFHWLAEKKAQGLVKHIGFSFHDNADVLDKILTAHPEMEFVQLQLNYLDWDSVGIQSRKCYEVAARHGKPVIVMEPVKGGTLAKVPENAEAAFKAYHPDVIYYIIVTIILWFPIDPNLLKFIQAMVIALFLAFPYWKGKIFGKNIKTSSRKAESENAGN